MIKLSQSFVMHPVGQGLFYSAVIKINDRPTSIFKMVFDCGSLNSTPCSSCVRNFRADNFNDNKTLDLLIISHFDEDHVSHLSELIGKDIKIKKLVMPFLEFEERLILALDLITRNNGTGDIDFSVRFIVDPLGTLGENLDDNSEVFLITKGPDGPPLVEGDSQVSESKLKENLEFDFDYSAKDSMMPEDTESFGVPLKRKGLINKVADNRIGYLRGLRFTIKLMEFIFYRRSIVNDEKIFFKKVADLFLKKYGIDRSTPGVDFLSKVIEAVIKQKDGRVVKKIFLEAKEGLKLKATGRQISDLNTTSLSMLHRNLPGIWTAASQGGGMAQSWPYVLTYCESLQFNERDEMAAHLLHSFQVRNSYGFQTEKFFYPNNLLTSDGFFSRVEEVKPFVERYRNYWNDFAFFQVPHHGSKKNSNKTLLAQIPYDVSLWINYGTSHKREKLWLHPDKEVILDITATGHSGKLVSVTELQGYRFHFIINTP